ncbi:transporter [Glutamicibacter sp. MNS18]|uniref:transporter n=1 Tax=Glutamicibacter sp. MNS18 TaxID=2989817 RepID=UPI00223688F6|nr:transporter [Glutamicibacter sp. MNS18]MCW4466590.1 transporter [Glutamicibacter sp. MNS18]
MVAHILKLKLTLLRNGFRRSVWQLVGVIVGSLYALGMVALLIVATWFTADLQWLGYISVLVSALVVLGWALIPPLLTGVDLTLEPQRFVHFGINQKVLGRALILAGFVSIPAVITLLGMIGFSVLWRLEGPILLLGLLANLATALLAVLACQYLTIQATALRSKRRFREASFAVLFLLLVSIGPIFGALTSAATTIEEWISPVAQVLSYTPFGTLGAVAPAAVEGNWALALLHLGYGLAVLGLLYWLLVRATAKAVVTAPAPQRAASAKGLGPFKWMPATPAGAVAARAMVYWFKDPRYALSVIMVPMLPVIFYFAGSQAESYAMMYLLGPLFGILLGFSISADVSYDNTAFSLHVLTGVSGRDDRLGRLLACVTISIVPIILGAILPGLLNGQNWRVPGDLGLSLGAFLVALAVSSVVSARYTYAVPLPGDNPLKTPPGNGMRVALTQLATFGGMGVLLLPVGVPYLIGLLGQSTMLGWVTLAAGLLYGGILLVVGIRLGGRWMDNRLPELMQAVMLNR